MIVGARASFLVIVATLAMSLVFMLIPFPASIAALRPAFYTLTVIFWVASQPTRFGLLAAWLAGLMLDVLYGTPLGEHALAMAIAAYAMIKVRVWLWNMPGIQQIVLILLVVAVYEFVLFWVDGVAGLDVDPESRWLPLISSALLWPIWAFLLDRIAEFEFE